MPKLSVVVPCYNEEPVVDALVARLVPVLESLEVDWEVVFVDDGSRDNTLAKLESHASADPRIKVLAFSRNFGHQMALTAGLEHASGDCAITMDADLQDPPELIPKLVEKWREGYEVVYARRVVREGESFFKRATARLFYWLLGVLSGVDIPTEAGDFRLLDRVVVDEVKRLREHHRMLRAFTAWGGFKSAGVAFERAGRLAGETKYTLGRMIKFAWDGVAGFSYRPLQMATWLGLASAGVAFLGVLWVIVIKLFGHSVPGWASTTLIVLFIGGVQLLVLGIIGEYLGRIYDEVKARPLYIIRKRINV